jgi:CBS domain-containing protein
MKTLPLSLGDARKRALVDTVGTILANKGREVVCVPPEATVYDAVAAMGHHEIGALPVVSEGRLIGIITERDYARKVILQGRSSKETQVGQIMTTYPVTVTPQHTIDECLRIVTDRHIRHLPVMEEGNLVGMISIRDLVREIISAQAFTIEQLHGYIRNDYPQ